MQAPSELDRPVSLAELLDGSGAREVLRSHADLFEVPLTVVDTAGRTLVRQGPPSELHELLRTQVDGRDRDDAKQAELRSLTLVPGESQAVAVRCFTDMTYFVQGIVVHGDTVGALILGPIRVWGLPLALNAACSRILSTLDLATAEQALLLSPSFEPERGSRCACEIARVVGLLLEAAEIRRVTSHLHLASIQDAYDQLRDKTSRLNQAVARMQEVDQLKSHFLANVSHELRTPLTSVIGYSEMLLEGLAGTLLPEQREYVGTIMEKGEQLLQIITGVLDVSRIEAGTLRVVHEAVELRNVVAAATETVMPLARRKSIALGTRIDEADDLWVVGDREKIRQILVNLLQNAIKFTPSHGQVEILVDRGSLSPTPGSVALTGATQGTQRFSDSPLGVRMHVRDSGIGIEREKLTRIFEPFFQVDASSTREYGGTGLGLTLVKSFVEAQGGYVWVESELGQGSCFTVALPRLERPA